MRSIFLLIIVLAYAWFFIKKNELGIAKSINLVRRRSPSNVLLKQVLVYTFLRMVRQQMTAISMSAANPNIKSIKIPKNDKIAITKDKIWLQAALMMKIYVKDFDKFNRLIIILKTVFYIRTIYLYKFDINHQKFKTHESLFGLCMKYLILNFQQCQRISRLVAFHEDMKYQIKTDIKKLFFDK